MKNIGNLVLFLLWTSVLVVGNDEQKALDDIAFTIQQSDSYKNCKAPQISSCSPGQTCRGTSCSNYEIKIDSSGRVNYLYLGRNDLLHFPSSIASLTHLTFLWFAYNKVTVLPSEVGLLTQLTQLDIGDNPFVELPTQLGYLTRLNSISLWNCHLTIIPKEFKKLTSLKGNCDKNYLHMDTTKDVLPLNNHWYYTDWKSCRTHDSQYACYEKNDKIYQKCSSVHRRIDDYNCGHCDGNNMDHCKNGDNQCTCLECNPGFERDKNGVCKSYQQIALDKFADNLKANGQTGCIAPNIFGINKDVKVNGQSCGGFTVVIDFKNDVKHLHIESNKLTKIPTEVSYLTHLTYFAVNGNAITEIPSEIRYLTKVHTISFGNNPISTIPAELWGLNSLRSLYLQQMPISDLPDGIGDLENLQFLKLYQMKLTTFPKEITRISGLTYLELFGNSLTEIPSEISLLSNLKLFRIENNHLTALPQEIGSLSRLTTLNIGKNYIDASFYKSYIHSSIREKTDFSGQKSCSTNCVDDICYINENGVCKIKCGSEQYREGDFCYLCSSITKDSICQGCDNDGLCAACKGTLEILDGECLSEEQMVLYNIGLDCGCSASETMMPESGDGEVKCTNNRFIAEINNNHVRSLTIRATDFEEIPDSIAHLTFLTSLSVSGTKLSLIPTSLSSLTRILSIDLSGNSLISIPTEIASMKMVHFNVNGNLLNCDYLLQFTDNIGTTFCENQKEPAYGFVPSCPSGDFIHNNFCQHCYNSDICNSCDNGKCYKCLPGFAITETNECTECTGNTYSSQGYSCEDGPDNCEQCNKAKKFCEKCKAGYAPNEKGECVECNKGEYSDDGLACVENNDRYGLEAVVNFLNCASPNYPTWTESGETVEICDGLSVGFNSMKIDQLKLSGRGIGNVPTEISYMSKMVSLDLSDNALTYIPTEINQMTLLTAINLQKNNLKGIPKIFFEQDISVRFNLNNNYLDCSYYLENLFEGSECSDSQVYTGIECANDDGMELYREGNYCYHCDANGNSKCMQCSGGKCTQCTPSYGLTDNICTKCEIHQFSDGSQPCTNMNYCLETVDQTSAKCKTCKVGHGITSSSACEVCGNDTSGRPMWSSGTEPCAIAQENCKEIDKTTGLCEKCDSGYDTFDGICKKCQTYAEDTKECILDVELHALTVIADMLNSLCTDENCKIDPCTGESCVSPFVGLSYTSLNLQERNIKEIPSQIGYLTALTFLDLSSNSLTSLPNEMESLTAMVILNLDGNSLTTFPDLITHFTALTSLEMVKNSIQTLPNGIGNLKSLTHLGIDWDSMMVIPKEIFYLTQLKSFHMANIEFGSFPTDIGGAGTFQNLVHLDLRGTSISQLPDCFGNSPKLTYINLSNNKFSIFPEAIIKCTQLKSLYMDDFGRKTILETAFNSLTLLKDLSLANNGLGSLPDMVGSLGELTYLDVSYNSFDGLPNMLYSLSKLKYLDISHNPFTSTLTDDLTNFMVLETFKAEDCHFSIFPTHICKLGSLLELNLGLNKFGSIPSINSCRVNNLVSLSLHSLRVNASGIGEFPLWLNAQKNMKYLDLSGNSLSKIPNALFNSDVLEKLIVSHNKLSGNPAGLDMFNNLLYIDMSYNSFSIFPEAILSLKNLNTLDLSHNNINSIGTIQKLEALKSLDLSYNSLSYLPEEFQNFDSLTDLNLSNNKMTEIPALLSLNTLKVLENIDLSNNYITYVGNLKAMTSLTHLTIKEFHGICGKLNENVNPGVIITCSDFYCDEIGTSDECNSNLGCTWTGRGGGECAVKCTGEHYRNNVIYDGHGYCDTLSKNPRNGDCIAIDNTTGSCSRCQGRLHGVDPVLGCVECNIGCAPLGSVCVTNIDGCSSFDSSKSVCKCNVCDPGLVPSSSSAQCEACPANQYPAGGVECKVIDNCVLANQHSIEFPECLQCDNGYAPDSVNGGCTKCQSGTYSPKGDRCFEIPNCRSSDPGLSSALCSGCFAGYGITPDRSCELCSSSQYSDGSTACQNVDNCVSGYGLKNSEPNCALCQPGYYVKDGQCQNCIAGYYCPDGKDAFIMENCERSNPGSTSPSCKYCVAGYAPVNGTCKQCTGNTFSSSGEICYDGPPNCLEAVHTKSNACYQCYYGYIKDENDECVECESVQQTSDGFMQCRDVPNCDRANRNGEPGCSMCSQTYGPAGIDNKCIKCENQCYYDGTKSCHDPPEGCNDYEPEECSCVSCRPGYYDPENDCQICPELHYCPGDDQSVSISHCVKSPVGLNAPGCTECDLGYELISGLCIACNGTHYGPDGLTCVLIEGCVDTRLAKQSLYCTSCAAGYEYNHDLMTCVACIGNTYSVGGENSVCVEGQENCVINQHSENKCVECKPGFGISDSGACVPCNDTTYSYDGTVCALGPEHCIDTIKEYYGCRRCAEGYGVAQFTSTANNECERCVSGTCSLKGYRCVAAFDNCLEGHINEVIDGVEFCGCSKCGQGYGKTEIGDCEICTGNTYSKGDTACLPGPEHCREANREDGNCLICEDGYEIDKDGITCKECTGNTYSIDGMACVMGDTGCSKTYGYNSRCVQCAAGFQPYNGACSACTGLQFNTAGDQCIEIANTDGCLEAVHDENKCAICMPGFAPSGNGTCEQCPEYKYSVDGKECLQIDGCLEIVSTRDKRLCISCQSGYELTEEGICRRCGNNEFSNETNKCSPGPKNCFMSDETKFDCLKCEKGFEKVESECIPCSGNSYGTDGISCVAGVTGCNISNPTKPWCMKCNPGKEIEYETGQCIPCYYNTYSADGITCVEGPLNCVECEDYRPFCEQCKDGYEPDSKGECIPCTGNKYSDNGRQCSDGPENCAECDHKVGFCVVCEKGYMVVDGACVMCDGNTYSDDGLTCKDGPPDCRTATKDHYGCNQCHDGFMVDTSTELCRECNPSYWSNGKICFAGPDDCATCNKSKMWCVQCKGGFEVNPDNGECNECHGPRYSAGDKCVLMENCEVGKPRSDSYYCLKCYPGFGLFSHECVACWDNTYSDDGIDCKAGPANCLKCNSTASLCTECFDAYDLVDNECLYHVPPPYFLLVVIALFFITVITVIILQLVYKKDIRRILRPVFDSLSYYAKLGFIKVRDKKEAIEEKKSEEVKAEQAEERPRRSRRSERNKE